MYQRCYRGSTWHVRSRPYQLCLTVPSQEKHSHCRACYRYRICYLVYKLKSFYSTSFRLSCQCPVIRKFGGFLLLSPVRKHKLSIQHAVLGLVRERDLFDAGYSCRGQTFRDNIPDSKLGLIGVGFTSIGSGRVLSSSLLWNQQSSLRWLYLTGRDTHRCGAGSAWQTVLANTCAYCKLPQASLTCTF